MKKRSGLSLVELVVFVTASASIMYFSMLNSGYFISKTREDVLKKSLSIVRTALYDYYKDHQKYPPSLTRLLENSPAPYLNVIPPDPMTGVADWQVNRLTGGWGNRFPESLTEEITDVRSSVPAYQPY